MCNSVARQERVCRAQRPAAKIDAIATSASGRDRTSAFEPAETPANCGLFLRDGREDSNYVPGMQFCRTSLRRGQERSSEGRPDSPPMSRNVVRERKPFFASTKRYWAWNFERHFSSRRTNGGRCCNDAKQSGRDDQPQNTPPPT